MLTRVGGISLIFLVATAGWLVVGVAAVGILSELLSVPVLFEMIQ